MQTIEKALADLLALEADGKHADECSIEVWERARAAMRGYQPTEGEKRVRGYMGSTPDGGIDDHDEPSEMEVVLPYYNAGLLGDGGGGDVSWWHDYIRVELDRAHEFYQSYVTPPAPTEVEAAPAREPSDAQKPVLRVRVGNIDGSDCRGVEIDQPTEGDDVWNWMGMPDGLHWLYLGPTPSPAEAASAPQAEVKAHLTITMGQLRDAMSMGASGDEDEHETELCFAWLPERTSNEGEPMEAGLYCWLADYPEEGCYGPLTSEAAARPSLSDQLWASDEVMAINAELGLTMEQLTKLARALQPAVVAIGRAELRKPVRSKEHENYTALTLEVLEAVLAERTRQKTGEGHWPNDDHNYRDNELARAAAIYANPDLWDVFGASRVGWPWRAESYKPTTRKRDLIKSAALIVAQLERDHRAEEREADVVVPFTTATPTPAEGSAAAPAQEPWGYAIDHYGWTLVNKGEYEEHFAAYGSARAVKLYTTPVGGAAEGWVSVEERLPRPFEEVLVHPRPTDYCNEARVDTQGNWSYSEYEQNFGEHTHKCRVTHWFQPPAAPQQGGVR